EYVRQALRAAVQRDISTLGDESAGDALAHGGRFLMPPLNRKCGECRVCCIVPSISVPDLQKGADESCQHLCESGCSIHKSKPETCSAFLCAWRTIAEIPDDWRPDRCGVLGIVGLT